MTIGVNNQTFAGEFAVWKAPDGQIVHVPYTYSKLLLVERLWDAYAVHRFFNHYWHYSLVIVAFYVAAVHVMQGWMRCR